MENNPTTEIRNEKTLFALIEKWGEERNFYGENGTTAKHQFLKLIEENGEMAGSIARSRNPIDDIGDQAVVLTHVARLCDVSLLDMTFVFKTKNTGELTSVIDQTLYLHTVYSQIARIILLGDLAYTRKSMLYNMVNSAIYGLHLLALEHGTTLLACMEHSYEEIKDRKGQMVNNVFVKESDVVQDAVENMTDHFVNGEDHAKI